MGTNACILRHGPTDQSGVRSTVKVIKKPPCDAIPLSVGWMPDHVHLEDGRQHRPTIHDLSHPLRSLIADRSDDRRYP